jgi:uncharacterized membrane protein YqjE
MKMATSVQHGSADMRRASTGELLRRLVDDLDNLVNRQVDLAKQEARENVQTVVAGGKVLGVGVGLLLCALIGLVVLIIALLNLLLPLWASALIVFGQPARADA